MWSNGGSLGQLGILISMTPGPDRTHPLAGLHLLPPQEPVHTDALVGQLALQGGAVSGRHRHVLQGACQADRARCERTRGRGQSRLSSNQRAASHSKRDKRSRSLAQRRLSLARISIASVVQIATPKIRQRLQRERAGIWLCAKGRGHSHP